MFKRAPGASQRSAWALPLFPGFLIQLKCRPPIGAPPVSRQEIRKANMRTPPEWVFHALTWSLAAIGLIAIAHMVPWPVIE
jgi:hypothetical protein